MADHTTPNLPSRDFDATEHFYGKLGFQTGWKDAGWMTLRRGSAVLEFFPYPDLDPSQSSFGCCLRLDDLDAMIEVVGAAGVANFERGMPRISVPRREHSGLRIAYLVDPDGSLLRLIQNED